MPRNVSSFTSEKAQAEEAIMEAHARVDRAREEFLRGLHKLSATFHAELVSTKDDLRAAAREISGVAA